MSDDKDLGAYVDGQLDAAGTRAFEAAMAADPELAGQVARQRALRARLSAAFDPILSEPVPERLMAAASAPPAPRTLRWSAPQWAAMAACLAVGVLAGRGLVDQGPLVAGGDGRLVARGGLHQALDRQLAADQAGRAVQVGLSFRTVQGDYCRTFQSARQNLAGLACREDGRWVARLAAAHKAEPTSGAYQTASSQTPPEVLAAVDALIAGEPLDAAGERSARARGWAD